MTDRTLALLVCSTPYPRRHGEVRECLSSQDDDLPDPAGTIPCTIPQCSGQMTTMDYEHYDSSRTTYAAAEKALLKSFEDVTVKKRTSSAFS